MTVTDRDLAFLKGLARYRVMNFRQVHQRYYATDTDGRSTRRRLSYLHDEKLVNKTHMAVVNPDRGTSAAVYYPSKAGCELLAIRFDDVSYLSVNYTTPQWQNLAHWQVLTTVHCIIEDAIAAQSLITMPAWYNEFDIINKDAVDPSQRYITYVLIRTQPKLCCVPDAALLLAAGTEAKAYYIELECGTNSPQKAAAEKAPGYAALAAGNLHKRHFPTAMDSFHVLMFAPTPNWRDALRTALSKRERPDLWRICSLTDLKQATFLTAPIFYPAGDGPAIFLVKAPVTVTERVTAAVTVH